MRTQRAKNKDWGRYTLDQADIYYDKLEIKCATREQYRDWFTKSERANMPCRRLKHFCQDCLLAYELKMDAQGRCAKRNKEREASEPRKEEPDRRVQ